MKSFLTKIAFLCSLMFVYLTISAIIEHNEMDILINEFKEKAEFVKQEGDTYYYKVKSENENEAQSMDIETGQIGSKGDIIVTPESPIKIPLAEEFLNIYTGGHASLVHEYGNMIETTGNKSKEENVVKIKFNDWHYYNIETVGLRVTKADDEVIEKVAEYAISKLGLPYNYTFILFQNSSFYCTDLITRAYLDSGIRINDDYLGSTIFDIIVSEEVYINYYKCIDEEGLTHIYYLE